MGLMKSLHRKIIRTAFALFLTVSITGLLRAEEEKACVVEAYKKQREEMVARQIADRGVRNPEVLRAMKDVPRHCFVPSRLERKAYRDQPLPIGHGQTISQPYIVALMSELLGVKPGQRVLEIGTGSGYQAAVLADMGVRVFSIEIVVPLGEEAAERLTELHYDTVSTLIGDGYKGWPRHAPFDGIIVTCAPSKVPEPLKEQLAEKGRMVIPVGSVHGIQELFVLQKIGGELRKEKALDVRFVPMVDTKGVHY